MSNRKKISISLTPEEKDRIDAKAAALNLTPSEYGKEAIKRSLENEDAIHRQLGRSPHASTPRTSVMHFGSHQFHLEPSVLCDFYNTAHEKGISHETLLAIIVVAASRTENLNDLSPEERKAYQQDCDRLIDEYLSDPYLFKKVYLDTQQQPC